MNSFERNVFLFLFYLIDLIDLMNLLQISKLESSYEYYHRSTGFKHQFFQMVYLLFLEHNIYFLIPKLKLVFEACKYIIKIFSDEMSLKQNINMYPQKIFAIYTSKDTILYCKN